MRRSLQKYLDRRAALTPWCLEGRVVTAADAAVVIPALAESAVLPATIGALATNNPALLDRTQIIVVVNHSITASADVHRDNYRTLEWLAAQPFADLHLAWIDAAGPDRELPADQGVGLARKIGFDAALGCLDWQRDPLLISLDADTLVDEGYLAAIFAHFAASPSVGAAIPFRHQKGADQHQEEAIRHYELYLRSYLFGLQQAGSPYAYHSIGSALACRAHGYIEAGGMNRRLAGEDFYFLQQLCKVGGVDLLQGTLVHPSPRSSSRTPFGTGRVVERHGRGELPAYRFTDARAFTLLRQWLSLADSCHHVSGAVFCRQASALSIELKEFLEERHFASRWDAVQKNHSNSRQRLRAFHHWFDALKTRQLLTRLTQNNDETEPLVEGLLSWGGYPGYCRRDEQLALLETLQSAV